MRSTRCAPPVLAALAVVVGAAVLAGCGSDDAATTTTAARRPTTTASTTTTTTAATTPGSGPTTSITEDVGGDSLPEGDQVGYLHSIDLRAGTVTVDLAELLTGPAAVAAYREDTGKQLDGDPVYVRNRNPKLRTVPIDPAGSYGIIYSASCCGPTSVTLDGLAEAIGGDWQGVTRPNPPFNISVAGNRVTAAVQIYQP
jgi:hypothetical protein